jgi:hypothetical protein
MLGNHRIVAFLATRAGRRARAFYEKRSAFQLCQTTTTRSRSTLEGSCCASKR